MIARAELSRGAKCGEGSRSWNLRFMLGVVGSETSLAKKRRPSLVGWVSANRREVR